MADPVQAVLGVIVLWAPGLSWTWALTPGLDWARFLFVSVVVAFTVTPGAMLILTVFLGVPLTAMNGILAALTLTALALAWGVRPRLDRAWDAR